MNCRFCGAALEEGGSFCGNCGRGLDAVVETEEFAPAASVKRGLPVGAIVTIGALALAVVILLVICLVSGGKHRAQIAEQEALIAEQASELNRQRGQINEMQEKCDNYDVICSLNNANIGHISNEFRVTKGAVVLSKNDVGKQITLTTKWYGEASIGVTYEGTSASLQFDNNRWRENTTMTIIPHHEGVTVVEFYNTLNSEKFKVLLVVTE